MPEFKTKPLSQLPPNVLASFWRHVIIGQVNECWEWFGYRTAYGYGTLRTKTAEYGDSSWLAHRIAYYIGHGIDAGSDGVFHSCDNPPCVNWNHLFHGTQAENNRDRHQKGRSIMPTNRARGFGHNAKARLTDDDVRAIRQLYATGTFSCQALAKPFGVHKNTIVALVRGLSYCHVK